MGEYLLYKPNAGWLTRSGNYTSSLDNAARFEYTDALARAKVHYNEGFGLIPVREFDLITVRAK